MKFSGFPSGRLTFIRLPELFFTEILPKIQSLEELKLLLYFFWRMEKAEGTFRYLMKQDFLEDAQFMAGMGETPAEAESVLDKSLQQCLDDGLLLSIETELGGSFHRFYFLNSPKGRAAVDAFNRGDWKPTGDRHAPITLDLAKPTIFRLYEENIGPLTPMLAEMLKEAEDLYPQEWIEEAFELAIASNVRSWRYIEKILRNWKERGRDDRNTWRDTEKYRRRYTQR
jgi:DnaD/phage-associated family protein